jgi:trehalose-6-phosphate synthase
MQWRLAYKDEVKALRTKLGSHVATISLLLMTQAVSSITTAEHDRTEATCGLQEKILAYRRLLKNVQTGVESSLSHQVETKSQLERQEETLGTLDRKADRTIQQLHDEHDLIQEVMSMASTTEKHTRSVILITTNTLS